MKTQSVSAWATRRIFLFATAALLLASPASPQEPVRSQDARAIQPSPSRPGSASKKFVRLELEEGALRWPPTDVDTTVPAVAAGVPCPLDEVLKATGQRAKELTANLERFSAIERVEDILFGKDGKAGRPVVRSFNYLVLISEAPHGRMMVDEKREGSGEPPPNNIAETGLVSSALIFHPGIVNDFNVVCEGLGDWGGQPAWQVHFAQRSDLPARFQDFISGRRAFGVRLKGRAWISAESYQVNHLEVDLVEPIPHARLLREHVETEYQPVEFASRKLQLWLPERVDLYLDLHGHHYYQKHQLSNFLLFSVETGQQIEPPRHLE